MPGDRRRNGQADRNERSEEKKKGLNRGKKRRGIIEGSEGHWFDSLVRDRERAAKDNKRTEQKESRRRSGYGGWREREAELLVGGGGRGGVGGVICLCQKEDEGAMRESSAVHLLASGGNTLTLALPCPPPLSTSTLPPRFMTRWVGPGLLLFEDICCGSVLCVCNVFWML